MCGFAVCCIGTKGLTLSELLPGLLRVTLCRAVLQLCTLNSRAHVCVLV